MPDDERDGSHSSGFGYRWFWTIGGVFIVFGVIGALSDLGQWLWILAVVGVLLVVLGYRLQRRGAPPY